MDSWGVAGFNLENNFSRDASEASPEKPRFRAVRKNVFKEIARGVGAMPIMKTREGFDSTAILFTGISTSPGSVTLEWANIPDIPPNDARVHGGISYLTGRIIGWNYKSRCSVNMNGPIVNTVNFCSYVDVTGKSTYTIDSLPYGKKIDFSILTFPYGVDYYGNNIQSFDLVIVSIKL